MAFSSHFKASMSLSSAQFEQGLKKAQGKVKSFNKELSGMFTRFLGATALVSFGKSVLDSTAKLGDMSKRLGVSTDFLQKFSYAMEQSGVNSDSAQVGLQRFIRRIGTAREEGGALKAELDKMNISLDNANGTAKSGEQLFLEFADGLGKIENPSAKLATAFKFLDSEGVAMLQTIGNGSEDFKKFGKDAQDLGLIIDGTTIKSMQDLDAELKKSSTKFKVLGAKLLPTLLKGLNLAVTGWQGIYEAVKTVVTGFELLAKTIGKYLIDSMLKAGGVIAKGVAKINLQIAKINPFADAKDVADAQKSLDKIEKKYAEVAKRTTKTFMQTRDEILRKDEDLNKRRSEHIENLKRISKEANGILRGRNNLDLEDGKILADNEQTLNRVLNTRNEISNKLNTQIERINALKNGGQKELALVIERQKAEEQIVKLMADGQLTREQAEQRVLALLDLEKQEKELIEELTEQEKEREDAKRKLSENNKLVMQLEEEKKLQAEIKQIEEDINTARLNGAMGEAKALEQKRLNLILDNTELANRDAVRTKLQGAITDIQNKRNEQNLELQVLDLIAQGRQDEADALQASMNAQKEIKRIQEELKLGEQEATLRLEKRTELEKQIALNKLDQNAQQIKNNAVQDIANKDMRDAIDADEKSRIRAGRAVIGLDERILELREKGGDRADKEIEKLESIKERKMEIILDDATKKDLADIDAEKVKITDDFDAQLKALNERLIEIGKAEQEAKQKEQERLDNVAKKQKELLESAKLKEEELRKKLVEVGNKAKDKLQSGFDSVIQKLNLFKTPNIDISTPDVDLSGLSSIFSQIPDAISNIDFPDFPEIPAPEPTSIKVEVDTDALLKETTGKDIKNALKGKFINQ